MRFVIEVPDELLRGVTGRTAAEVAPDMPQPAPLSGGMAADGALQSGARIETLSAGAAEGGGVRASMDGDVMTLDGGAAPE